MLSQEAGVPPVSILTGKKQFSHLCSSVIPYPIGTTFAREVPASKGSLHTKLEENRSSHFRDTSEQNFVLISSFFSSSFRTLRKIRHKTRMRARMGLKFGTLKRLIKADLCTNFGRNPMNIHGVMTDYLRKIRSKVCHAYRVNSFEESVENLCRWSNYRRSAFLWFERNRDKDHGDMTQNPTCVKITRSIFMNKKTISFRVYQANCLEQ